VDWSNTGVAPSKSVGLSRPMRSCTHLP
jgi:hypothetical protein